MKSLMKFDHIDASSIEDATSLLQKYGGKAWIIAGGTDVIGTMRFEILDDYPEALINLKSIPGMDYITEENGTLRIGALARLHDISVNSIVKADYPAGKWVRLAETSVSSSGAGTSGKRKTGSTASEKAARCATPYSGTTATTRFSGQSGSAIRPVPRNVRPARIYPAILPASGTGPWKKPRRH
jgi:hypothetical protein